MATNDRWEVAHVARVVPIRRFRCNCHLSRIAYSLCGPRRQQGMRWRMSNRGGSLPTGARELGRVPDVFRSPQSFAASTRSTGKSSRAHSRSCGSVDRGADGRGCGSAHAAQLPHWIYDMNPSQHLYNRTVVNIKQIIVSANKRQIQMQERLRS